MAITVTHAFVSGIADDPKAAAAGEVLPSHWNSAHVVSGSSGREVLAADRDYFVSATGSDANNGLTSGAAWATLQHAMHIIATTLDMASFTATVNIGAGTFAGFGAEPTVGGGTVVFLGAGSSLTTIIDGPGNEFNFGECFTADVAVDASLNFNQVGFKNTTGNFTFAIYAPAIFAAFGTFNGSGGGLPIDVKFDATNTAAIITVEAQSQLQELNLGGAVTVVGGGGTTPVFFLILGGQYLARVPWTVTGSMAGNPFCEADSISLWTTLGGGTTFTGAGVTGKRYNVTGNSVIDTAGGGANFFPGTVAGTSSGGGQYL